MSYLVDPLTISAHQGLRWAFGNPSEVFSRQRRVRVCFHEIEALAQSFSLYVTEADGRFGVTATLDHPESNQSLQRVVKWPVLTRLHPFGVIQDMTGEFKLSLARDIETVLDHGGTPIFEEDHLHRSVEAVYRAARRFISSSALLESALSSLARSDLLERVAPDIEAKHAFGRPLWTVKAVELTDAMADLLALDDPRTLSAALTIYFALLTSSQNQSRITKITERKLDLLARNAAELTLVMPEGGLQERDTIGASFLVDDDTVLTYQGHGTSRFFGAG